MTRINLVHPKFLTDQHLIAEKKEINQLAGQLQKSVNSINFNYSELPTEFKLGTGHVRFFYRYGKFIKERYQQIYDECVTRRFDVTDDFNDVWSRLGSKYTFNYNPTNLAIEISKERLLSKVLMKPGFYRYNKNKITYEEYENILNGNGTN